MTDKLKSLHWVDVVILAMIFFGLAIYDSNVQFFELLNNEQVAPITLEFSQTGNWWGIIGELVMLVVAYSYLKCRKFDFKQLNFNINRWTIPKIILYILLAGIVATSYEYLQQIIMPQWYPPIDEQYGASEHLSMWSLSFVLFALINGFYEEMFFIGLVASTTKRFLPFVIALSLFIRFAFHTYQGIAGAFTITMLGVVFLLLRYKSNELLPFVLAHSFFDLFGLGLPLYLFD